MNGSDQQKLYETCYMQVYSYLLTLCRDAAAAEELTQETFFRAMTAPEGSGFSGRSSELTWLCAIAKNLWTDELRRQKHTAEMPADIISGDDIEAETADADLSFRIHQILHTLEEPYKEVFQLRVFGELSFAKIGAIFGKTENWARVTYHRARLKIQERMKIDKNGS